MEYAFSVVVMIIVLFFSLHHLVRLLNHRLRHLPPGPLPLPMIGNLHQLTHLPHQQLRNLSRTYGPIMLIYLGNVPTVVVSSPRAAELFLKTHDAVFSSRPRFGILKLIPQWQNSMLLSPSNSYWRHMRRLCTQELLTDAKVKELGKSRQEVLMKMVDGLRRWEKDNNIHAKDITRVLADSMEELVCHLVMRCDDGKRKGFELGETARDMLHLVGTFNIGDYIPIFRPFDLQGLGRRAKELNELLNKNLDAIISGHEQAAPSTCDQNFVDILLAQMNKPARKMAKDGMPEHAVDRTSINAIMFDMIAGGVETTSTTVDWALSEMIRNPGVLKRLQDEMEEVVGKKRMVEESDIPKLGYLDMVVKETLRLHPPGPLMAPHESFEDVVVDGYLVPKGARVMVNVWAIGRDPDAWSTDAEIFRPERFQGLQVDLRGRNFEFLPFGSGRRSCPGMNMGLAMVKLTIAQLVHCFDWEMPKGLSPGDIDMSEQFGLSVPRANPLCMIPHYRLLD
ncbi:hypothetical protein MLD38_007268 [Melastoma candidum]|uniref:Uncharacterized protein n=1 Tax=Melastoma candidum TaxID=119954 RepID=A0ACB9RQK5_9MYRT|nr:hypothetical protein MLD38_007268 [Melastoma candidum]